MKKSQNMGTKNIFMPFFFFYCKVDLCKNYLLADRVVEEVNYKLKTKKTKKKLLYAVCTRAQFGATFMSTNPNCLATPYIINLSKSYLSISFFRKSQTCTSESETIPFPS